ncbi:MAG: cell surface protein SprA [Chitinophagales bacterium]
MKKNIVLVIGTLLSVCTIFAAIGSNPGLLAPPNFDTFALFDINSLSSDSIPADSLLFPIDERENDFMTGGNQNNPFDFDDPSSIEQNAEYDPETNTYIITETYGEGQDYRPPTYMTFEEFWKTKQQQMQQGYWLQAGQNSTAGSDGGVLGNLLNGAGLNVPKIGIDNETFCRIFGGCEVDIRPTGSITMGIGFQKRKIENPTANLRFADPPVELLFEDPDININVLGKVGSKLKLDLKYNTKQMFDFQSPIKLEYVGNEDEIIQEIRAGQIDFPLPTALIPGSQNLFGIQTKLKFGRLTINSVLSQQKSRPKKLTLENGAQEQEFEVDADNYDANRHFFLAQYFRNNYEKALAGLPYINSEVTITRLDVWVNDTRGTPEDVQRDLVAFADLGENEPFNINTLGVASRKLPENSSNNLYGKLYNNSQTRSLDNVTQTIESQGGEFALRDVRDFRKTLARKLEPTEYTYDPQLGFVSLNFSLQPDEVLAVAYEYTTIYGGLHQVGEFAEDIFVTDDDNDPRVLFMKMLKSTTQIPTHPIWDLMMKNVYALGAYQVDPNNFQLDVYYENAGGGDLRYIPEGEGIKGVPLIRLFGLDRLNSSKEPYPDGIFDFVSAQKDFDGQSVQSNTIKYGTVNPKNGRLIFPVLEPFGEHLRGKFCEGASLNEVDCAASPVTETANKYVYEELYDSTLFVAREYPEYNRFVIKGTYTSSISSEISLGAFNIPQGSVRVTAGGKVLEEGIDYEINYSLGRLTILNEAYVNAGTPINVSFEDNGLFGLQQRTFLGTRLDYLINPNFTLGATAVRLSERPFTPKVNYGDDPIANSMIGLDGNYFTKLPWLTKGIDRLPLLNTKEESSLRITAEGAGFLPGHARAIGKEGTVYIDDFEGSKNAYDLKFPYTAWRLASTPKDMPNEIGTPLFPEAALTNDLRYGFNRAKLSWYQIDLSFGRGAIGESNVARSNYYAQAFNERQIFPNKQSFTGNVTLQTFDLSYYPDEKGPYNFETEGSQYSAGIDENGKLKDPSTRWGGVMRDSPYNDFEASNVEFLDFWVLDPFIYPSQQDNDGELYIQLGNISEDILKDSRQFYENGLPAPDEVAYLDETAWGLVPKIRPVTFAFNNDVEARAIQDVGLDGLPDDSENNLSEREHFAEYLDELDAMRASGLLSQTVYDSLVLDPANDNFRHFRDEFFSDAANLTGIPESQRLLYRYKNFSNPDGNSPATGSSSFTTSGTNFPEMEELNDDQALNDAEQYFQYRIKLQPNMEVGQTPYLVEYRDADVRSDISSTETDDQVRWYHFRVPVREPTEVVGDVSFRNISFMRMVLTDFEEPVICRFARFDLVRNTWRRYNPLVVEDGEYLANDVPASTFFNLSALSFEENGGRQPIPYAIPPNIERELTATGTTAQNLLQNEQALTVQVGDLRDGYAKGIFKRLDVDMRQFKKLQMYIHAESLTAFGNTCNPIETGDVSAFVRLGDDFQNNYYEYEIPLTVLNPETDGMPLGGDNVNNEFNTPLRRWVWPAENEMNINLKDLVDTKMERNFDPNAPTNKPYSRRDTIQYTSTTGETVRVPYKITVVGSPDLGQVKQMMMGVRNPKKTIITPNDDGLDKCAEVWFNELRLSDFDESAGWAAIARADLKLADLGQITATGQMHTVGFGTLEQRANERYRDNFYQYDVSGNFELGKFLPDNWGVRIPVYGGITQSVSTPQYDPYNTDILLKEQLDSVRANYSDERAKQEREQRQSITTIKSVNATNVRKERTNTQKKPMPWDIANFSATYAYTETKSSDHVVESDLERKHTSSLDYIYTARPLYIEPFKKIIKSKSLYLRLIKDFNFNLVPSNVSFRNNLNARTGTVILRSFDDVAIDPFYNKEFIWNRTYGLKYNPTRSITFDYNATHQAVIDETPYEPSTLKSIRETLKATKDAGLGSYFGRPRMFEQAANISYNVPLDKFPLLSWTQLRTRYGSTYYWEGKPVGDWQGLINGTPQLGMADTLGNVIGNTQNIQINGELDFNKLYNSIPFLKKVNSKRRKSNRKKPAKPKLKTDTKDDGKNAKKKPKSKSQINPVAKAIVRPFLMLRRISLTYDEKNTTEVPGFNRRPSYIGMDWENQEARPRPGWDFAFGTQPILQSWLEWASGDLEAADSLLTNNLYLTEQVMQSKSRNVNLKANLEPFRDFKIDVNMKFQYSQNHTEFYKVDDNNVFNHLSKMDVGNYSISYFTLGTMFDKREEIQQIVQDDTSMVRISQNFRDFEDYRETISSLYGDLYQEKYGTVLGEYYDVLNDTLLANYKEGYGPRSVDVMLPAFLAAYSGRAPQKNKLNGFNTFPLPNWRVTYNGLSKLRGIREIFSNFNLSHSYNSTLSINNYRNNLEYDNLYYNNDILLANDNAIVDYLTAQEAIRLAENPSVDTLTGNFVAYYQIPQVMVSEQLAPLIGIDITLKNGISAKFDYKKSRMLSMSFQDFQLTEQYSDEFTIGAGYALEGLKLPTFFKIKGKPVELENQLSFNFDLSLRDTETLNYRLDEDIIQATAGMRTFRIAPSIDYVISNSLRISLFYERTRTVPRLSNAFPTTQSKGGIRVSFMLGQ